MLRTATLAALLLASFAAAPARADVYRWTDENGMPCFAGSLAAVPPQYRAQVSETPTRSVQIQQIQRTPAAASTTQAFRPARQFPGAVDRIAFRRDGGLMLVDVQINGGVVAPFYVDTAASGVSLPTGVARELGLLAAPASNHVTVATAAGPTRLRVVALDTVQVGRSRVEGLSATVNPNLEIGLLGGDFLNQFSYSVDPTRGVLVLRH